MTPSDPRKEAEARILSLEQQLAEKEKALAEASIESGDYRKLYEDEKAAIDAAWAATGREGALRQLVSLAELIGSRCNDLTTAQRRIEALEGENAALLESLNLTGAKREALEGALDAAVAEFNLRADANEGKAKKAAPDASGIFSGASLAYEFAADFLKTIRARALAPSATAQQTENKLLGKEGLTMTQARIEYMVTRFLGWKLPTDFSPDAGISFKSYPGCAPSGTNLLDATQATAMIQHMIDGMPGDDELQALRQCNEEWVQLTGELLARAVCLHNQPITGTCRADCEDNPLRDVFPGPRDPPRPSREHAHAPATAQTTPDTEAEANGIALITAERQRQIEKEGWTPEHDDEHDNGELARAAAVYALPSAARRWRGGKGRGERATLAGWPWDAEWFKPGPDRVRELTKAGALIAAEIDRLLRDKE